MPLEMSHIMEPEDGRVQEITVRGRRTRSTYNWSKEDLDYLASIIFAEYYYTPGVYFAPPLNSIHDNVGPVVLYLLTLAPAIDSDGRISFILAESEPDCENGAIARRSLAASMLEDVMAVEKRYAEVNLICALYRCEDYRLESLRRGIELMIRHRPEELIERKMQLTGVGPHDVIEARIEFYLLATNMRDAGFMMMVIDAILMLDGGSRERIASEFARKFRFLEGVYEKF